QARCVGFAGPTTRLRRSISSSRNGAVLGMAEKLADIALPRSQTGEIPGSAVMAVDIGASPRNGRPHAGNDEKNEGDGHGRGPRRSRVSPYRRNGRAATIEAMSIAASAHGVGTPAARPSSAIATRP